MIQKSTTIVLMLVVQFSFAQIIKDAPFPKKNEIESESSSKPDGSNNYKPLYIGIGVSGFSRAMSGMSRDVFSVSYSLGIEVEKQFSYFGLKSGLYFQRKGQYADFQVVYYGYYFVSEDIGIGLDAYYLTLPLYGTYHFGPSKRFSVETGLYTGYLLGLWNVVGSEGEAYGVYPSEVTDDSAVSRISLGLHFAFGYELRLNAKYKLGIVLFDDYDMLNVLSNSSNSYLPRGSVKNSIAGIKVVFSRNILK